MRILCSTTTSVMPSSRASRLIVVAASSASPSLCALFIGAGPVTTVPLLLFAAGARRISFSLLGVLQYAAPSLQWLIGIFLFHESFDPLKALGFGFVWVALAMFAGEGIWYSWQRTRVSD